MKIKYTKNRIVISFQEQDPYFEMGNFLIKQSGLVSAYQHKVEIIDNKTENEIYIDIEKLTPLSELLPKLPLTQIMDIVYYLIYMTRQIEESGFLKRHCIWCKYEDIYYDEECRKLVLPILPVSDEITTEDGMKWEDRFLDTIHKVLSACEDKSAKEIEKQIIHYMKTDESLLETLEAIRMSGDDKADVLLGHLEKPKESWLQLYHSSRDGILDFIIKQDEYVIGKQENAVDGWIPFSEAVSRVHCKIIRLNKQFFLQDLDSVNHTFVNDELIPPFSIIELNDRDIIHIADVEFRAHID